MTKAGERESIKAEQAYGGESYIAKEMLISDEARGEHCKMYAKVTVPVGCEIGYHMHQGDEESYYILSGTGIYNDNGTEMTAELGDSFFCKDGDRHGKKYR